MVKKRVGHTSSKATKKKSNETPSLKKKVTGFDLYPEVLNKLKIRVSELRLKAQKKGEETKGICASEAIMFYINLEDKLKLLELFKVTDPKKGTSGVDKKTLKEHIKKLKL